MKRCSRAPQGRSVNACTPKDLCRVEYPDFSEAVLLCIREGKNCFIARSDNRSAFRNLGIWPGHWRYLIMKAKSPIDNCWYFFIDKCLPFGASISSSHFQKVSDAISHLVTYRTGKPVINYLDDYLFAALLRKLCNLQVQCFLSICHDINLPVSQEKTFWGDVLLIFLGLLLDTVNQLVGIPLEKISKGRNMLKYILDKSLLPRNKCKITVLKLQKLCGFLNFLCHAVVPGRAFTRRFYTHLANTNLKPHHHIHVTNDMINDAQIWLEFLKHPSSYWHPFMDFERLWSASEISFFTDASRNFYLGFGGYCDKSWMQAHWTPSCKLLKPSIQFLELFALTAGVLAWGHRFMNKRIIIFCDNESIVSMIN